MSTYNINGEINELLELMAQWKPQTEQEHRAHAQTMAVILALQDNYRKEMAVTLSEIGQCMSEHHWKGRSCPTNPGNCEVCDAVSNVSK